MIGLAMAVLVCLERPRQRGTERTDVDLPVDARLWSGLPVAGRLLDVSFSGTRFVLPWSSTFGPADAARQLVANGELVIEGIGPLFGKSRWISESAGGLLDG